ncbi:hypothetical protein VTJ04DRAFT_5587 [Mycothermus thermophilus]|uniref:uncharacterized protein n=1 Tax=Humicola insolens TaxID=85995 RepID=UPI00374384C4
MDQILSGVAMGAALTTAGVYSPDIILGQFKFTDFTMLQTFLTAAAGSTLVVSASQALGLTKLPHHPAAPLGVLPSFRYDGNLIGGALLGTGMVLAGACPGTTLAQLGVGVRSGRHAFTGAVLAGIVWAGIRRRKMGEMKQARAKQQEQQAAASEKVDSTTTTTSTPLPTPTILNTSSSSSLLGGSSLPTTLGLSKLTIIATMESAFLLAIYTLVQLTPAPAATVRGIPPYLAGLAIAGAQAVSLLLRRSPIGASSAFEELGWYFYPGSAIKYAHILFSVGLIGGAWAMAQAFPALRPAVEIAASPARSVLGGFLMVLGARMSGGCTSGHGISGLSLLSVSSVVTVAAVFGAGAVVGLLGW